MNQVIVAHAAHLTITCIYCRACVRACARALCPPACRLARSGALIMLVWPRRLLEAAEFKSHAPAKSLLAPQQDGMGIFHDAAASGDASTLRWLASMGADLHMPVMCNGQMATALWIACTAMVSTACCCSCLISVLQDCMVLKPGSAQWYKIPVLPASCKPREPVISAVCMRPYKTHKACASGKCQGICPALG